MSLMRTHREDGAKDIAYDLFVAARVSFVFKSELTA